ncbi:hypothetical protein FRC06_011843 [Ceratobasidium sp. 370]|nr:hypothetical protein FRC06_011843 [Ceratobasidium sp. 370]
MRAGLLCSSCNGVITPEDTEGILSDEEAAKSRIWVMPCGHAICDSCKQEFDQGPSKGRVVACRCCGANVRAAPLTRIYVSEVECPPTDLFLSVKQVFDQESHNTRALDKELADLRVRLEDVKERSLGVKRQLAATVARLQSRLAQ